MRATALLLLAYVACAAGDAIQVFSEDGTSSYQELQPIYQEEQEEPETVFRVDQDLDGSLRVTGMMQSFRLDSGDSAAINELLTRPRSSFLDLSWSNWVDQRIEMLDLIQNWMAPVPRCPHMRPESGALDRGMVSYLASSRFGPAILTTYAEKFQDEEEEDDFDYEEVYIPEGEALGKTYEDASLLEDLSADADKAFQIQEADARSLGQRSGGGFFGANLRTPQDKMMYAGQLDGSSESVQPNIRQDPPIRLSGGMTYDNNLYEDRQPKADGFAEEAAPSDMQQVAGFLIFTLLCLGCVYVWASLLCSCCRMGRELGAKRRSQRAAAEKVAQEELVVPLLPEGADRSLPEGIQIAAAHAPSGTYFAPRGAEYVTIAVPLVNGEARL